MPSPSRLIVTPPASTVIALIAIALAGIVNLPYPFNGDQALFTLGAKMLASGGVLYRDFWDLKQPGIYWFYHAAGALFGFTEIGIHIAELLWFILLAICVSVSMRQRFRLSWMSDVCSIITVGVYFSVCGSWHLTQLEGLVSLPILLCLWLVIPGRSNAPNALSRFFMMGMLVAVIALFKILLAAIPLSFLIISLLPRQKSETSRAIRSLIVALLGSAVVMIPVICYFASEHQSPIIYKTFFVYPARIVKELPMNKPIVLLRSGRWFFYAGAPLLPLAVIAAFNRLRQAPDRFAMAILAWIVLATVLVLIQHMWWEYHFLLILFPLGIAATMGLEDLFMRFKARPVYRIAIAILVTLPYVGRTMYKAISEARFGSGQTFRAHVSADYTSAMIEAAWLSSQPPGEIYVMGDPQITFLSDRKQDVVINGWSPEFLLPEQWSEIVDDVQLKKPQYIFIASQAQAVIDRRGKPVEDLIITQYSRAHADEAGAWYSRLH